jgi:hypothetical protein
MDLSTPPPENKPAGGSGSRWQTRLKQLGLAGFLFFFIKGLVWIAVFTLGWKGCNTLRETERAGMRPDDAQTSAHEVPALQHVNHLSLFLFILEVEKGEAF